MNVASAALDNTGVDDDKAESASKEKSRERREAAKRSWVQQNVTPSRKRLRLLDGKSFYIPEAGRPAGGSPDAAPLEGLRGAIISSVATHPGICEPQLLELLWGYPMCSVRGVLSAMASEGTLSCCTTTPGGAQGLFAPMHPGSGARDGPAEIRYYFLGMGSNIRTLRR